jgi:hypothetical protein
MEESRERKDEINNYIPNNKSYQFGPQKQETKSKSTYKFGPQ